MFLWILLVALATVHSTPTKIEKPVVLTAAESMHDMIKDCGVLKSCLVAEPNCIASKTCEIGVTVQESNDLYWFEMRTLKGIYVAVGLSTDAKMGNDAVVECVYNNVTEKVDTFVSWNVGHSNTRLNSSLAENGITVLESSYVDESVYCAFTRTAVTTVQGHLFDLEVAPYHLLVVAGDRLKPGSIGFHDMIYAASTHSQYLFKIGMFDGSADSTLTPEGNMAMMTKDCGVTKACYTKTKNATIGQVTVGVTIFEKNDLYIFEMRSTTGLYIAVGLSDDRKMGKDSVVDCRYFGGKVNAHVSWNNEDYTNTPIDTSLEENGITLLDASYKDDSVYCKFTRKASTVVGETTFDLDNTPYYVLLSAGTKLTVDGELEEHNVVDGASAYSQYLYAAGLFDGSNGAASSLQILSYLLPIQAAVVLLSAIR